MESWYCSVTDSILLTLSVLYSPLLCLKLLVPPEIWRRTLCRRLKGGMLGFKSRQKIRRIGILMASDLLCLMNYIFVALVGDAELSFPRAHVLIFEPSWHFHLSLNVPAIHKKRKYVQNLLTLSYSPFSSLMHLCYSFPKCSQYHEGVWICNKTINLSSGEKQPQSFTTFFEL